MKRVYITTLLATLTACWLAPAPLIAQGGGGGGGRGNFDPEQMRQRMMDNYRERLEVTSDSEWNVLQPRIQKVVDARREAASGRMGGFGMMGMGNRQRPDAAGGGGGGGGADQQRGQRRAGFGGQPDPDLEALQKAIDSKASADEIKTKLAKYRDSRKQKEAALEQAQADLKKLLSVRQEAVAVTMGLLQ